MSQAAAQQHIEPDNNTVTSPAGSVHSSIHGYAHTGSGSLLTSATHIPTRTPLHSPCQHLAAGIPITHQQLLIPPINLPPVIPALSVISQQYVIPALKQDGSNFQYGNFTCTLCWSATDCLMSSLIHGHTLCYSLLRPLLGINKIFRPSPSSLCLWLKNQHILYSTHR